MSQKIQPSVAYSEDLRTLWRERHGKIWTFYCPQCRAARRTPTHPDPARMANFARIGLCALVFMIATWNWFAWKGVVSFVPFWAAFEIFHRSRMRGMLACPHCGFDPYLYLIDVKLARQEMEHHWKKKFAEHGIEYPGQKHEVPGPKHESPVPEAHLASETAMKQKPEELS